MNNWIIAVVLSLNFFGVFNNTDVRAKEPSMNLERQTEKKLILRLDDLQRKASLLMIKNTSGVIVFAESVEGKTSYRRVLNLTNLETGNYRITLSMNDRILKQNIEVERTSITVDFTSFEAVLMPIVKIKDKRLELLVNAEQTEVAFALFDGDLKRVYHAKVHVEENLRQYYNLSDLPTGRYTAVVQMKGETFTKYFNIE